MKKNKKNWTLWDEINFKYYENQIKNFNNDNNVIPFSEMFSLFVEEKIYEELYWKRKKWIENLKGEK